MVLVRGALAGMAALALGGAVQVAGPWFDPAGALGLLLQKGAVVALVREEEPRSDELLSRR